MTSTASRVRTRKPPTRLAPKKIPGARLPVTGCNVFGREEDFIFLAMYGQTRREGANGDRSWDRSNIEPPKKRSTGRGPTGFMRLESTKLYSRILPLFDPSPTRPSELSRTWTYLHKSRFTILCPELPRPDGKSVRLELEVYKDRS
jgi:hypothetical protein